MEFFWAEIIPVKQEAVEEACSLEEIRWTRLKSLGELHEERKSKWRNFTTIVVFVGSLLYFMLDVGSNQILGGVMQNLETYHL
jgi:hypothetical protein